MNSDLIVCPFCHVNQSEIIAVNKNFIAKYDCFPVSEGHVLIIPKRHLYSFFQLTDYEVIDFFRLLRKVKNITDERLDPDGYNIGINQGEAAGQTISHLHIHIIPRHYGDVQSPEGGVRNIIPNLVAYPALEEKY